MRRRHQRDAVFLSRLAAGVTTALLIPQPASSQILPPEDSVRFTRNVAVRERQIPGYETAGLPVGSFTLSPRIGSDVNYTDNVYALAQGKTADEFVRISPAAQLQSNWTRQSLTISAEGAFDRYFHRSSENVNGVVASAYGTADLGGEFRVRAIARYRTTRESRESQNAFALTQRPILYRDGSAAFGVSKRFSNLLVSGEAGVDRIDYDDGRLRDGTVLQQNYRNGTSRELRGRADFIHSPAVATFVQISYNSSVFSQRTPLGIRRGADTLEALAGTRFQLPILARGEIGVGYIQSSYRDGRFRRFSGLAVNSLVTFFVTELTNVTVNAVRSVNDAGTPESSTYVALSGGVRVDHELLRAVLLGAGIAAERDRFNGLDRKDARLTIDASVQYRMNRNSTLRLTADRLHLSSTGDARYKSFTRNRVMVGVELRV